MFEPLSVQCTGTIPREECSTLLQKHKSKSLHLFIYFLSSDFISVQTAGETWPVDSNRASQSPHSSLQDNTKAALVQGLLLHSIRIHRLSHLKLHRGAQILLAVFVSHTAKFTFMNYHRMEQVEANTDREDTYPELVLAWEESHLAL